MSHVHFLLGISVWQITIACDRTLELGVQLERTEKSNPFLVLVLLVCFLKRYGGGPFVLEFIEFPQWTRNFRPPRARTFSIIPLKNVFFRLKTPGNFRDFLGDHFARVESSGDQNLTMFILDFHVFLHFWPPKIMKIQGFAKPFKTPSPGTMPRW